MCAVAGSTATVLSRSPTTTRHISVSQGPSSGVHTLARKLSRCGHTGHTLRIKSLLQCVQKSNYRLYWGQNLEIKSLLQCMQESNYRFYWGQNFEIKSLLQCVQKSNYRFYWGQNLEIKSLLQCVQKSNYLFYWGQNLEIKRMCSNCSFFIILISLTTVRSKI
jgi:hypothetical protein